MVFRPQPDELPFEVVDKSERRSPLQELHPRDCNHKHAYTSEKYPASGTRYICVDCSKGSAFARDLE